ncbi:MAG: recombinase family protein [Chloroflexi bacterium]|nr:recombinase family protein [Chloroflexota bacterium]
MIKANSSDSLLPIPGAAYIRYSSEMQSDSFSLDAQLRQIKEQAERDNVTIIKVYSDPAQSAYRKKFRPGINAMRDDAKRGLFKILYVHKVDRLARRLEWSLEIVHELQSLNISFKAVEQPFDLRTPEGKLLFHLVSSLGEFYSDNLSKETNKGKLERSTQGFHNGAVPWGYISQIQGNRKMGVPNPDKAPVVVEMYERYSTGAYSDLEIAEWLTDRGYLTNRNHPFGKDTVRDMLCNTYYMGKIRYRGMTVRPADVSFRSTTPRVSDGKHEAIISEELWNRCQAVRASRRVNVKSIMKTVRINLLQGLVVCSHCGRRLNIQTPKNCATYYRENSHHRGYHDCPYIGQSVRAEVIDTQVADLIRSIHLPDNWEPIVRQMLNEQRDQVDPEAERKEIRGTLRLMRENFERGLYEEEEYQYWQKVSALKEKLALLERTPEPAINRAAKTLLDLRSTWENTTQEERKDLVHVMIQEVGVDLAAKSLLWVKARPDYEPLFSILDGLRLDSERRYWIESRKVEGNNSDIEEDAGHMSNGVKILLPVSHNTLTSAEEYIQ